MKEKESTRSMNWKLTLPECVRTPAFGNYGGFVETRPVKVDCSLGVNPLGNLCGTDTLTLTLSDFFKYPNGAGVLNGYIRSRWPGVSEEEIVWGTGSQGVLAQTARILGGNAKILGLVPQFLTGLMEFAMTGTNVSTVRLRPDRFEIAPEELADRLEDDTTLLYLDNPHNPTGSALPLEKVDALAGACAARGALLLVDEAYGDFLPDGESALNLKRDNVVCVRSFSKGCGMAGLRIGYAVIRDAFLRRSCVELGASFPVAEPSAVIAARFLPTLKLAEMRTEVRALKSRVTEFIAGYRSFSVAKTHPATPIFLLTWLEGGNLYEKLMEAGIQTEAGHFFELGDNSVRLRVPRHDRFEEFCSCWRELFGEASL